MLALSVVGLAFAPASSAQVPGSTLFSSGDIMDAAGLSAKLSAQAGEIDELVWSRFDAGVQGALSDADATQLDLADALVEGLNSVVEGGPLYDLEVFRAVRLSPETTRLALGSSPEGADLLRLNRLLLEDSYTLELRKSPPTPPTPLTGTGVRTTQFDYPPGATAHIVGWGFEAGEPVDLQVLHGDGTPGDGEEHGVWTVEAGPDGGFQTTWHVCEDDCLNSTLLLAATGRDSATTAEWIFTDAAGAGAYQLLKTFGSPSPGAYPSGLIQGMDGALYGTASSGGATGNGTVFKMDLDGGNFSILHHFDYHSTGGSPQAGLVQGPDGALYGTTASGGPSYSGTVFKLDPDGSNFTVLHGFDGTGGASPYSELILGANGALYGTTAYGGSLGYGVAFKLDLDGSNYTLIHEFDYTSGATPLAGLTQGPDGTLYGTTYYGGASYYGTAFKMGADGSDFTVLRDFDYTAPEGGYLRAGLTLGLDGALYGVIQNGYNSTSGSTYGAVFKMDTAGGNFVVLHTFDSYNGAYPYGDLIQDSDGVLYGTTNSGGSSGIGTAYRLDADGANFTSLHSFSYSGGAYPDTGLLLATNGSLYGVAYYYGPSGYGTAFRLNKDGSGFSVLKAFTYGADLSEEGGYPVGGLVEGPDGAFYGTTQDGSPGAWGTIYRISPNGGSFTTLKEFDYASSGAYVNSDLIVGQDGALYGVASSGGAYGAGTAFKLSTDGSNFQVLHDFEYSSGGFPGGELFQGPDGTLYGTTSSGGPAGSGTVFRMDADGANYLVLHGFYYYDFGGAYPYGGLILGADGALYGTTAGGDYYSGAGGVFKLDPTDGSNFTVLKFFSNYADGQYPYAGVTQGPDGSLYGTTYYGGVGGGGTIFRLAPDGSDFTVLHSLDYYTEGAYPLYGELALTSDGVLYGTAYYGGSGGYGTLYRVNTDGTDFEVVLDFDNTTNGAYPYSGVVEGSDGNIYGTTYQGGAGGGTLYRLTFNTPPVADCDWVQLTAVGDTAQVAFSGLGSTDTEDEVSALSFEWTIQDAVTETILHQATGAELSLQLAYGDYVVSLTVTDSQGSSDTCTIECSVDPALLALFECEKVEVRFCLGDAPSHTDDDSSADHKSNDCTSDRVSIKGEIGLPMGVDHSELEAVALVSLDVAGDDFLGLGGVPILFDVQGSGNKHWRYEDHDATLGITKFDIDWKGARFKYEQNDVPVEFRSELITSTETVLTMEYRMSDIAGPFTVQIDGALLEVDAAGVVTSNDVPAESTKVKKKDRKVTVTLPFPLVETSTITFGGSLSGTVYVADHYTHSLGRFKLEAESGAMMTLGAETTPRSTSLMIGIGGPLYPGWCDEGPDDLKTYSQKWRAKH